ncbi:receptor-like protein kinase [Musa troglodytarum]|uniref:histone acetyltransferase n=1 Tax=Musa troglodytarum TaxID=320322 RepID=A0A9E7HLY1_9LILI|nr:receptor-like protein kinase [Musa troglodytarum]
MALKQKGGEISTEAKKRRRVGFANIDTGIEASECIKVFLVKSGDEVGSTNSFCINPVDLNQFFGEDGKIYGYKGLRVNIWLSTVSFHAYSEITFESTSDGGKGITDLEPALQDIFGELLTEKEQFLQTFSTERNFIRNIASDGAVVPCKTSEEDDHSSNSNSEADGSMIKVIRMKQDSKPVGLLYSRLVPLVLLLVDGGSPIDVTDPRWEIFLVVKKVQDPLGDCITNVLGFATVYRFFHYPDSTLSENIYDVTAEEPSDYLQYLRACIDTKRLLCFQPIKPAINSVVSCLKEGNLSKRICRSSSCPPASVMEIARQKLKINKKQFLRCWEVLIYLNLNQENSKCTENFRAWVSDRVKSDIVDKDAVDSRKHLVEVPNDYDHDMTFVVCWLQNGGEPDGIDSNPGGNQSTQDEQLNELVKKRLEDIVKITNKALLQRRKGQWPLE